MNNLIIINHNILGYTLRKRYLCNVLVNWIADSDLKYILQRGALRKC